MINSIYDALGMAADVENSQKVYKKEKKNEYLVITHKTNDEPEYRLYTPNKEFSDPKIGLGPFLANPVQKSVEDLESDKSLKRDYVIKENKTDRFLRLTAGKGGVPFRTLTRPAKQFEARFDEEQRTQWVLNDALSSEQVIKAIPYLTIQELQLLARTYTQDVIKTPLALETAYLMSEVKSVDTMQNLVRTIVENPTTYKAQLEVPKGKLHSLNRNFAKYLTDQMLDRFDLDKKSTLIKLSKAKITSYIEKIIANRADIFASSTGINAILDSSQWLNLGVGQKMILQGLYDTISNPEMYSFFATGDDYKLKAKKFADKAKGAFDYYKVLVYDRMDHIHSSVVNYLSSNGIALTDDTGKSVVPDEENLKAQTEIAYKNDPEFKELISQGADENRVIRYVLNKIVLNDNTVIRAQLHALKGTEKIDDLQKRVDRESTFKSISDGVKKKFLVSGLQVEMLTSITILSTTSLGSMTYYHCLETEGLRQRKVK